MDGPLEYACMDLSILELWANDGLYDNQSDQDIAELTLEQVLEKINGESKSGVFLIEKNFTDYLSNVKRDGATGRIIGAEATIIRWWDFDSYVSCILTYFYGGGAQSEIL